MGKDIIQITLTLSRFVALITFLFMLLGITAEKKMCWAFVVSPAVSAFNIPTFYIALKLQRKNHEIIIINGTLPTYLAYT